MSQMDSAQTVLTLMRSDSREGNTPDSYTYSAMLRALSNCKQWDMLEPLYNGMVKRGLQADIEVSERVAGKQVRVQFPSGTDQCCCICKV